MNQFAKHSGGDAKQLPSQTEKLKQINKADVAELVDARDLKFPATPDRAEVFCKTHNQRPAKTVLDLPHLQNGKVGTSGEQLRSYQPQNQDHLFTDRSRGVR